jgi:hypothetical protein
VIYVERESIVEKASVTSRVINVSECVAVKKKDA